MNNLNEQSFFFLCPNSNQTKHAAVNFCFFDPYCRYPLAVDQVSLTLTHTHTVSNFITPPSGEYLDLPAYRYASLVETPPTGSAYTLVIGEAFTSRNKCRLTVGQPEPRSTFRISSPPGVSLSLRTNTSCTLLYSRKQTGSDILWLATILEQLTSVLPD